MTVNPTHTALWPAPHASGAVDATVHVPGSKSVTNRALVLAALASEPGWLRRPLRSRDTLLMAEALRTLGVEIDASSSSQFVSALLLSGPRFNQGVEVRHTGSALPSMPHIRMTVDMLRAVGAQVDTPESGGEPNVWRVTPGALLGRDLTVEPDLSNAQPFLAAALVTGGKVVIPDWPSRTTQPGDRLREIFTDMGGSCELTDFGLVFTGSGAIHGIDVDLSEVGELTPGIAAVAALADSPSTLRGVAHLRLHETDRLAALTKEINELGGDVTETADGLHIRPRRLHGGVFHTYDDHRMATAGAVLGLAVEGVQIENVATTAKTLPDFPDLWTGMLGA